MSLVTAIHAGASYAGTPALRDVDMTIDPGEIVTVVGPNGSGKSTLIRLVLGVLKPTSGRIERKPGLRIGYVPQKLMIDGTMPLTVDRFLSLPVRRTPEEIETVLERVKAQGLGARQMRDLSGGQFQRVLLARAILAQPDLFVLDEPTQGLDQPGIGDFYRLIEDIREETGAAVLMVSHDLHVVMSATDKVLCLNGHVCCSGTPDAVMAAPEYRALFGGDARDVLALYQHHHDHSHDASEGAH